VNFRRFLAIIAISVLIGTTAQVYGQYGGGPPQSSAGDYTVSINSDKESYSAGDIISLSGSVNKYDEKRSLQITIFNSANKLALNTEIPVAADGTFSYNLSPNEKFSEAGQYTLRAQYGKTHVDVKIISFTITDKPTETSTTPADVVEPTPTAKIPDWIKSNAGWWADGSIDDNSFVQGLQFLIKEKVMSIPPTEQGSTTGSNEIPAWIKQNAKWWADGSIDDNSFVQGIQFLIKTGIMKISS
jgi:hypothetical protein